MNSRRVVLALVGLTLVASFAVRLASLGYPGEFAFDEVYYAKDARAILKGHLGPGDAELAWEPGIEISWPHPEMGKLAIAAGQAILGFDPWGWRIASAIAGTILLALIYPLARRLRLPRAWALAALLLAASDMLLIAQSRIATLDIFVGVWTVLCIYLALVYVQSGRRWWWLVACGAAGGMALGTKWSGALALVAAIAILLVLHRREPGRPLSDRLLDAFAALPLLILCLVVLPAAIYFASYTLYFTHGHTLPQWWELHKQMWEFNMNLQAEHSYASRAHTWIFDARPVWYYYEGEPLVRGIIAMGNPLLWWASVPATIALLGVAIARRDRRLLLPPLLVVLLYLPWLGTTRTSFLYYMTPVVPFMAIALASALALLAGSEHIRCRWAALSFAAGGLAMYLLWHPLGSAAQAVFWSGPLHVSRGAAVAATGLGVALVLAAAVATLVLPRLRGVWRYLSWAYVGVVGGTAAVFLPIVLARPITLEHFYRLMWFSSWI